MTHGVLAHQLAEAPGFNPAHETDVKHTIPLSHVWPELLVSALPVTWFEAHRASITRQAET